MKQHWLDVPRNVARLWQAFLGVLALTVIAEPFVTLHPQSSIEGIFGFHAAYGLLTCIALIAVAKGLGVFLKRPDTYYERRDG